MKKIFANLILLLVVVSLSACSHNTNAKSNIISSADVSDREQTILSTTADKSFVLEFNQSKYKEVKVWVEKYEAGELINDQLSYLTTQVDKEGSVILATTKAINKKKQQTYHIGIGDKNGTSSASFSDDILKDSDDMSGVYGDLPGEKSLDEREIVLASIAYSDDAFGTSSISNRFYEDPSAHMDELKDYNLVYLFKAEFLE